MGPAETPVGGPCVWSGGDRVYGCSPGMVWASALGSLVGRVRPRRSRDGGRTPSALPDLREPVVPEVESFGAPSADLEHGCRGVDAGEVAQEEREVEVEVREQIKLVDQDQL